MWVGGFYAILVALDAGGMSHANLGNLLKVSRGGRGEHGVGTGFAVIGVSHKRSSTPNGAKVKSIESMNI